AESADRLERSAGRKMLARLLVQLGLVIARVCGRGRCTTGRPAALGRLATVIRGAGSHVAQDAVSFGDKLATRTGVLTLDGRGVGETVGVVFRYLLAVCALDLFACGRARYSQQLVVIQVLEIRHFPPLGSFEF